MIFTPETAIKAIKERDELKTLVSAQDKRIVELLTERNAIREWSMKRYEYLANEIIDNSEDRNILGKTNAEIEEVILFLDTHFEGWRK